MPRPQRGTEIPISGGTCKSHANESGGVLARGTMTGDTESPLLPFPGVPCPGIQLCMSFSILGVLPSPGHSWTLVIPSGFPVPLSVVPTGDVREPKRHLNHPQVPPSWIHPCHHSQAGKQLGHHLSLGSSSIPVTFPRMENSWPSTFCWGSQFPFPWLLPGTASGA